MFHALIAGCADSGDLSDGTLRPGAAGSADGALPFIRTVVERLRQRVCESVLIGWTLAYRRAHAHARTLVTEQMKRSGDTLARGRRTTRHEPYYYYCLPP